MKDKTYYVVSYVKQVIFDDKQCAEEFVKKNQDAKAFMYEVDSKGNKLDKVEAS